MFGRLGRLVRRARARRFIDAGDRHRDRQEPALARIFYRKAVSVDPALYSIWIQLGHAEKDSGRPTEARLVYERARSLDRTRGEPNLFLGQLDWLEEDFPAAMRKFRDAARSDDVGTLAVQEIAGKLGFSDRPYEEEIVQSVVRSLAYEERNGLSGAVVGSAFVDRLVLDLTDLVRHFASHRRPTGIQRVQLELAVAALAHVDRVPPVLAAASRQGTGFVPIPPDIFREVARLSVAEGRETEWRRARTDLFLDLSLTSPIVFPAQAIMLSLGLCWEPAYLALLSRLKAKSSFHHIVFVHDLIPAVVPQYCTPDTTASFDSWLRATLLTATAFLANSASTRRDLLAVAEQLGQRVRPDRVALVPLDAPFESHGESVGTDWLATQGLDESSYVLFVGTLETRKNHALAFDAWVALIARYGTARVPPLVCAGRDGWMNDGALARLNASEALAGKVVRLADVGDAQLSRLYRSCLFSIYPSHYEGWGLPVSESLSYGKVPVVARNSSLVEAGGGLAVVFEDDSLDGLVEAVAPLILDRARLERQEVAVRTRYRPRSWARVWAQVADDVDRFLPAPAPGDDGRRIEHS